MTSLFASDSSDFRGTDWQPTTQGPEASLSEYWDAAYERYGRAFRGTSYEYGLRLELEPIVERAKRAGFETGLALPIVGGTGNPAAWLTGGSDSKDAGRENYEYELERLNKFLVENNIREPITQEELDSAVKAKAIAAEAGYQNVSSDWLTTIVAEAGSAIPHFLMDLTESGPLGPNTAILGASWKSIGNASQKFLGSGTALSVARVAGIDALIGAGQEVYLQAGIKAWRDEVGLKHTYGDMATAVAAAAGFSGAFRAVGSGGVGASRATLDTLFPERALGREMLSQVGSSPMAVRLEGVQSSIRQSMSRMSHEQLRKGFTAFEQAGVVIPPLARGALNALEREADLAESSPFKVNDAAALAENEERVSAEIVNLFTQGEQRIEIPPTTREVAELDVHHYDNLDGEIYRFNPAEIEVDAKTFQFKSGIDERGIVSGHRLEKETRWDPALSGTITVYEYANGRRFIADGHQRLGLAQRILANDPSQEIKIYGRLIKETDGHTPQDAMIDASLVNIANTPLGDERMIIDAAKVMRIRPEALKAKLPPRSQFVRRIYDLVELSDESFQLVVNEIVRTDYAAMVGRLVRDKDKHMALLRVLKDTEPSNVTQAEAIVRQAMDTEFTVATQDTLFGEEMLVESLFKERAKVLDETIKILRKDRAVFNSLVQNEKRIEAGGNTLSTDQNAAKARTDGEAIQTLQITANRKGPLSDALTEAAKRFKETGRAAPAARDFADAVRGGIERGDINGIPERGEIIDVDAPPQIDSIAASHVERLDDFAEPGGKGYEAQADALERELVETLQEAAQPNVALRQDLKKLVDANAERDVIEAHPAITDALERALEITPTHTLDGYLSDQWQATRVFNFNGEEVVGYESAIDRLYESARQLGWIDDNKIFLGEIAQERKAVIVTGPPASGKSTIANKIAQKNKAAIFDSDEAKKVLPEYEGGIGANAVHEESGDLMSLALERALEQGDNIVLPKVGDKIGSIEKTMELLKLAGYEIQLVHMYVQEDEAFRRMIARFISTGRLIPPEYMRIVGENPRTVYNQLKGKADAYGEIDNTGPKDATKEITDASATNPFEGVDIRFREVGRASSGESLATVPRQDGGAEQTLTEITDAGEQMLMEGVEAITGAQRAQAAVDAPMQGGDAPMDIGLFDTAARAQSDLLDMMIPTGRMLEDANGKQTPEMRRVEDEFREIEQDASMLDRLKDCAK